MNTLKAQLNELPPEKLKVLMAALGRKKPSAAAPAIQRQSPNRSVFPLSFAQQRVWFFEQMFPGTAVYNWPFAIKLQGALDYDMTRDLLTSVVNRHDIFRTTLRMVGKVPMQHVSPAGSVDLDLLDLSAAADPEAEARKQINVDTLRSFDLENGPLYRFMLFHLGEHASILAGTFHHSIIDAWSGKVLLNELTAYAELARAQSGGSLSELPIQYGDYAAWQRSLAAAPSSAPLLDYWKAELRDLPAVDLPGDRPRPTALSFEGGVESIELPAPLIASLRKLAQQQGTTLFSVLLAAFLVLIQRYSGSDDVATAIPVSNRGRSELEGLIGFFVNTLIIRADLAAQPSFRTLVTQIRAKVFKALEHQDVPFERLVELLRPARHINRNPFTTFMFQLEEIPGRTSSERPVALDVSLGRTAFDLDVHLHEERASGELQTQGAISGTVTFSAEIFDATTIRRLVRSYTTLLQGAALSPDSLISELPLVSEEDAKLIDSWNDTQTAPDDFLTISDTIAVQSIRRRNAPAVQCDGQSITYRELHARVSQLTRYLRSEGIGRGELVAVSLDRSPLMVIALLAVLRAGAAYVPLDPAYPTDRLQAMVEDAEPALLLTTTGYAGRLELVGGSELCLDTQWDVVTEAPDCRLAKIVPSDTAYVIYTSGSTGKPKGVEVCHRGLSNVIATMTERCQITEADVWLGVTSISFDIAALEIFLPLTLGAKCVLATRADSLDPERLYELISRNQASVMQATPATWQMLTTASKPIALRSLKIISGGEALPPNLAERLVDCSDSVWNAYGPTETTIWSSLHRVSAGQRVVPIGKPLANTQLYILDERHQRVPIGVEGDLYIGGHGLAKGYRAQPSLTAERFLPDPFSATSGARMYRTGDRARLNRDGDVEYVGRVDNQVKIRGFRVELEEIEACMLRLAPIIQAAAQIVQRNNGAKQLVAYYKLKNRAVAISQDDVLDHLRTHLPDYMVPSALRCLDFWPLTFNGKLDRKALPPVDAAAHVAKNYEEPVGHLERTIAAIWSRMLNVPMVGRNDHFFDLGGDSLASVQMVHTAKDERIFLRPSDVFQHPTLAALADVAAQRAVQSAAAARMNDQTESNFIELTPAAELGASPGRRSLYLVHPAGGDVMSYHALASRIHPSISVIGIAFDSLADSSDRFSPVEAIAARYVVTLRARQPSGPYLIGGWSFGGLIAFEMARQLEQSGEDVREVLIIDQTAPSLQPGDLVEGTTVFDILRKLELLTGRNLDIRPGEIQDLGEEAQMDFILAKMKQQGLFPDYVVPAAFRNFIRSYDQHIKAATAYAGANYGGRVTVLRAMDPLPEGVLVTGDYTERTLGWQRLCGTQVRVYPVPGHHLSVVAPPNAAILAETLNHILDIGRVREVDLAV